MIIEYMLSVASEWVSGWLTISGDDFGTNVTGDDSTDGTGRSRPAIHPLGLISRPRDPSTDPNGRPVKGAGLLTFSEGGDSFSMPTTDPTAVAKVPPVKKGGTALYGSGPNGGCVNIDGDNGTLQILIPNANASKNHNLSIDSTTGAIQIIHADGMKITIASGGANSIMIMNKAGNAYIEVNDAGVTVNGNLTLNGGLALGQLATAVPAALFPAFNAWAQAVTSLAVQAAKDVVAIAPDPSVAGLITAAQTLATALPTQGQSTKLSASP